MTGCEIVDNGRELKCWRANALQSTRYYIVIKGNDHEDEWSSLGGDSRAKTKTNSGLETRGADVYKDRSLFMRVVVMRFDPSRI